MMARPGTTTALLNAQPGTLFQNVYGRIPHQVTLAEAVDGRAYNRWLIERILPQDERIKALLYLPFNTPKACLDIVRDFGEAKGVIGT